MLKAIFLILVFALMAFWMGAIGLGHLSMEIANILVFTCVVLVLFNMVTGSTRSHHSDFQH